MKRSLAQFHPLMAGTLQLDARYGFDFQVAYILVTMLVTVGSTVSHGVLPTLFTQSCGILKDAAIGVDHVGSFGLGLDAGLFNLILVESLAFHFQVLLPRGP